MPSNQSLIPAIAAIALALQVPDVDLCLYVWDPAFGKAHVAHRRIDLLLSGSALTKEHAHQFCAF
jgi:hypothetical protein